MIELAPGHKSGLLLQNPVMLAVGSVGCGEAVHARLDVAAVGAVVVGPITEANRAGAPMPRLAELPGGIILETGGQNRGLTATLREYGGLWSRLGVPIVAHLADSDASTLARVAERLAALGVLSAIEVGILPGQEERRVRTALEAVVRASELPVLVKMPLVQAAEWMTVAAAAGACAVVMGRAPDAAALVGAAEPPDLLRGQLFGPAVFPQVLRAVADALARNPGIPVVACGGIHTVEQARQILQVGAAALQLDSLVWLEPEAPAAMARMLAARAAT